MQYMGPRNGEHDTSRLARDVRWLKAYALVTSIALGVLATTAAKDQRSDRELTVERINVVDPSGETRLVIANSERFPLPKVGGKEFPRAVHPAGLVFYDARGSEVGGIAITDSKHGKISALAFDYPNYDAMGMVTRISPDGSDALAGFHINSRPPADLGLIEASKVVERRVAIQNQNENAEILLADPQGRTRIRLQVDNAGTPSMQMLDENGKVTFSVPGRS